MELVLYSQENKKENRDVQLLHLLFLLDSGPWKSRKSFPTSKPSPKISNLQSSIFNLEEAMKRHRLADSLLTSHLHHLAHLCFRMEQPLYVLSQSHSVHPNLGAHVGSTWTPWATPNKPDHDDLQRPKLQSSRRAELSWAKELAVLLLAFRWIPQQMPNAGHQQQGHSEKFSIFNLIYLFYFENVTTKWFPSFYITNSCKIQNKPPISFIIQSINLIHNNLKILKLFDNLFWNL